MEKINMAKEGECIRILHVIGAMNLGGAETLIMNLYRNIDRTKVQFDVVVHTRDKMYYSDEITDLGGRIYHAPAFKGFNITEYVEWWNSFFLKHPEYKIVHGHIGSTAPIYLKIAKKHGRFAIAHSHNTNGGISPADILFRIMSFSTRWIADEFFGCSIQAGIDRYGNKIAASEKFHVMQNGIDVERYRYSSERRKTARESLSIDETSIVWGHVGRFVRQKNHEKIIEVFYEYHKANDNSILLLFGDGPEKERITSLVEKMNISDSVKFMGLSNRIDYYLQAMDIFIFPSLNEGLGIALVEAQAAGLPCLTSDSIVNEADIGAGLIKKMQLSEKPEAWVHEAEELMNIPRKDTSQYALEAGYDIKTVSKELQKYYSDIVMHS